MNRIIVSEMLKFWTKNWADHIWDEDEGQILSSDAVALQDFIFPPEGPSPFSCHKEAVARVEKPPVAEGTHRDQWGQEQHRTAEDGLIATTTVRSKEDLAETNPSEDGDTFPNRHPVHQTF